MEDGLAVRHRLSGFLTILIDELCVCMVNDALTESQNNLASDEMVYGVCGDY